MKRNEKIAAVLIILVLIAPSILLYKTNTSLREQNAELTAEKHTITTQLSTELNKTQELTDEIKDLEQRVTNLGFQLEKCKGFPDFEPVGQYIAEQNYTDIVILYRADQWTYDAYEDIAKYATVVDHCRYSSGETNFGLLDKPYDADLIVLIGSVEVYTIMKKVDFDLPVLIVGENYTIMVD